LNGEHERNTSVDVLLDPNSGDLHYTATPPLD
jgi:hypothetical protein